MTITGPCRLLGLGLVASFLGCGGGGGGGAPATSLAPPPPPVNQSPGGIWIGTDSEGDDIIALITEAGRFHFLETTTLAQGSGNASVSNGNDITASFRFVPPVGFVFADGSTFSDCTVTGTVAERTSLSGTVNCTSSLGNQSSVTVNLAYDTLYDLNSSLGTFAGTWTDASAPGIDIVNVDSLGVIIGQDGSGSNCIYSGQVSLIDANFNAYDVEWTYSSCIGNAAILNGVSFSGIGAIDNTVTPVNFILGATGFVQGNESSLILVYERI